MITWSAALDDFEERVLRVERSLSTGEWGELPPWGPPREHPGPPGDAEVERLRSLLDRAERVRQQVLEAMTAERREVARGWSRWHAARRYLVSEALSGRRS